MGGVASPVQPWRELSEDERREWAAAVAPLVKVDRAARLIVVSGSCPACGHPFELRPSDRDVHEELRGGHFRAASPTAEDDRAHRFDWKGTLVFLAGCYCEQSHPQRPPVLRHGCGASGWLIDEPEE